MPQLKPVVRVCFTLGSAVLLTVGTVARRVGVLCEACFQTGAIFLSKQIEKEGKSLNDVTPVLSRITDARFKQMVKPGDEITIEVTMKETISRFFFMSAKVLKDGKPAMTIGFALAMVEGDGK